MTAVTILLALNSILLLAVILITFLSCANIIQDGYRDTSPRTLLHRLVAVFAVSALSLVFTCTALLAIQGNAQNTASAEQDTTTCTAKPIKNLQTPPQETIVKIESLMRSQSLPEE